jgi:hypothetical protein
MKAGVIYKQGGKAPDLDVPPRCGSVPPSVPAPELPVIPKPGR